MLKKYTVRLTSLERQRLLTLVTRGTAAARQIRRANALLLCDEGKCDPVIAAALHMGLATVARVRRQFSAGGVEAVLGHRPPRGAPRKLTDTQESWLVSLVGGPPPAGYPGWSLRRLVDCLLEEGAVKGISPETVRKVLLKHGIRLRPR